MKNICFTQCGRWPPLGSAHPPGATCSASGCTRRGVHAPVAHIVRTGARSFARGASGWANRSWSQSAGGACCALWRGPGSPRAVAAAAGVLGQGRSSCQAANTSQTHGHTSRGETRSWPLFAAGQLQLNKSKSTPPGACHAAPCGWISAVASSGRGPLDSTSQPRTTALSGKPQPRSRPDLRCCFRLLASQAARYIMRCLRPRRGRIISNSMNFWCTCESQSAGRLKEPPWSPRKAQHMLGVLHGFW